MLLSRLRLVQMRSVKAPTMLEEGIGGQHWDLSACTFDLEVERQGEGGFSPQQFSCQQCSSASPWPGNSLRSSWDISAHTFHCEGGRYGWGGVEGENGSKFLNDMSIVYDGDIVATQFSVNNSFSRAQVTAFNKDSYNATKSTLVFGGGGSSAVVGSFHIIQKVMKMQYISLDQYRSFLLKTKMGWLLSHKN